MNQREKSVFYRQLSVMLESGLPLLVALDNLASGSLPAPLKNAFWQVHQQVAAGGSFSTAMEKVFTGLLEPLEISTIRVGERSGHLPEALKNLATYFEFLTGLRTRMLTGLLYPVILLHAAIIIPAVPLLILRGPMAFFSAIIPFFVLFYSPIIIIRLIPANKIAPLRGFTDEAVLHAPVLGKLLCSLALLRFYQAWLCLYSAGVSILEALDLAARATGNKAIETSLLQSQFPMRQGKSLTESLLTNRYLSPEVRELIKTGELSGRLEETLGHLVTTTQQEVNTLVERMVTVLPVVVYLLVAAYVGFVVVSFYAGYFREINSLLQ
ncbi:MAG TPA: type II secretion system F family protein [bacterium]|nr:type II secretion system F family protein [bacterium]